VVRTSNPPPPPPLKNSPGFLSGFSAFPPIGCARCGPLFFPCFFSSNAGRLPLSQFILANWWCRAMLCRLPYSLLGQLCIFPCARCCFPTPRFLSFPSPPLFVVFSSWAGPPPTCAVNAPPRSRLDLPIKRARPGAAVNPFCCQSLGALRGTFPPCPCSASPFGNSEFKCRPFTPPYPLL